MVPVGRIKCSTSKSRAHRPGNSTYKVDVFPKPSVRLQRRGDRAGLDGAKMSRATTTIPLFVSDEELRARVMRVKTGSEPRGAALNPDEDTTFKLYALVAAPAEVETLRQEYLAGTTGHRDAKQRLFEALQAYFGPFRDKRAALENDLPFVEKVLRDGAERASAGIQQTLDMVRDAVGLGASKLVRR